MSKKTSESMSQTISDIRSARNVGGMKTIAIISSLIIYVAIVGYTEYHFYNLVSRYVTAGFEIVAYLAVGASFLTALALPVALHVWLRSGIQQVFGFIFYGGHWLIVMFNLVLDSNLTAGGEVPEWVAGVYGVWILPMYLSFYGIGWAILWFLDPAAQEIDDIREVESVERENAVQRRLGLAKAIGGAVEKAYDSYEAKRVINTYAARKAPQLLASELGTTLQELGLDEKAVFAFWEEGQQQALPPAPPKPAPQREPVHVQGANGEDPYRPTQGRR